jgi:lipoprotein-anchoring transpeptidase ErfK/SrfK
MLRSILLTAALFAVVPSVSAFAAPGEAPESGPAATTQTQSGTTTFFGKSAETKDTAAVVKKEPVVKMRALPPTLVATVDLSRQTMTVAVDGEPRYRWSISSGTSQFPTPTGNFLPQWKAKMWYSKQYDNSPMPNAVFIKVGVAVHATYYTAALGSPASHGCIRLSPKNASTFYNLVERHGMMRTRVNVHGRPHWRDDAVARRDSRRDDDYADNGGGWFWGSSYNGDDERRYRKNRKDYKYVYKDGVRTKVDRHKSADNKSGKRQRYSDSYAYEAN